LASVVMSSHGVAVRIDEDVLVVLRLDDEAKAARVVVMLRPADRWAQSIADTKVNARGLPMKASCSVNVMELTGGGRRGAFGGFANPDRTRFGGRRSPNGGN